jgi:Na+/H+-dicarboxylate symporter
MTMGVLFIAHATNIRLSLAQQAGMFLIMMLTSKGAAGVTGGGLIALAATLPILGTLPVAGLSLLIGADFFMAQVRAGTNLFSNIIATVLIGRWVGAIDLDRAHAELDRRGAAVWTSGLRLSRSLAPPAQMARMPAKRTNSTRRNS